MRNSIESKIEDYYLLIRTKESKKYLFVLF